MITKITMIENTNEIETFEKYDEKIFYYDKPDFYFDLKNETEKRYFSFVETISHIIHENTKHSILQSINFKLFEISFCDEKFGNDNEYFMIVKLKSKSMCNHLIFDDYEYINFDCDDWGCHVGIEWMNGIFNFLIEKNCDCEL